MAMFNSRLLSVGAIALACSLGFAQIGLAQGKGHGGNTTNSNSNGINATDRDTGTDRAGDRMSTQGVANTNGPNATDRDKGSARATDRSHK
jgi:hypothetical protein